MENNNNNYKQFIEENSKLRSFGRQEEVNAAVWNSVEQVETRHETTRSFVVRTYLNLFGAVALFAVLEAIIFSLVGSQGIIELFASSGKLLALVMLGLCLGGPSLGTYMLTRSTSRVGQYGVLGYYSVLYALIFTPILAIAQNMAGGALIMQAVGLTVALFAALSSAVFITRANFSFLRTGLTFFGLAAFILILASWLLNFTLGVWFSAAMIVLMCGYILYETSMMIHEMDDSHDVIASIMLFSSLMTLFYYVLRLVMAFNRR
ncbi:MAG: Bax inhibitor-1 family protein [Planctomycetia bacterium]|nr:Bax inhibitor-1 family protein [Planctomycetia bacterium]